jgi:antirestriction protein ArdC
MISTIFIAEKFQIGAGLSGYVAEMNAAFCCASLGIAPTVRHADYIGSWLEVLREDNRAIVRAASQASKAADWLLSHLPAEDAGEPVPAAIEGRVAA